MSAPFLPRLSLPLRQASRRTTYICQSCAHQSSYRRTRKALGVKPNEAFRPSKTETQDHIIHNPPSSLPNIYHTPSKFLPANDPRHKQYRSQTANYTTATIPDTKKTLPPAIGPIKQKKYHLTAEQIAEIRRLREEDPRKWTRLTLAEKFDCSPFFISLCAAAPREVKEGRTDALAEIKKKWGPRRSEAREARKVRKEMWGRDA